MKYPLFSAQSNCKQLSALLCLLSLTPTIGIAGDKTHLRGKRYCEVIISTTHANYAVYNTIGLNDCPAKLWSKVTTANVKKETGASFVRLNGPRYWVIDGFKHSTFINPTTKTLSGLPMREAGMLHINMLDALKSKSFFQQRKVTRHTTWVYQAGKAVYELIDPKGHVFVMQSYSVQTYPQTEHSLSLLGGKLQLPKDWQFKTGILKKPETLLATNNKAIVVQDNFFNTYQMATHDFLK